MICLKNVKVSTLYDGCTSKKSDFCNRIVLSSCLNYVCCVVPLPLSVHTYLPADPLSTGQLPQNCFGMIGMHVSVGSQHIYLFTPQY